MVDDKLKMKLWRKHDRGVFYDVTCAVVVRSIRFCEGLMRRGYSCNCTNDSSRWGNRNWHNEKRYQWKMGSWDEMWWDKTWSVNVGLTTACFCEIKTSINCHGHERWHRSQTEEKKNQIQEYWRKKNLEGAYQGWREKEKIVKRSNMIRKADLSCNFQKTMKEIWDWSFCWKNNGDQQFKNLQMHKGNRTIAFVNKKNYYYFSSIKSNQYKSNK